MKTKIIIAALTMALSASVGAEVLRKKAIICDTPWQLEKVLAAASTGNGTFISKITGGECNHDTSGSAFIVININNPSDYTVYEKNAPMQHPLPYCNGSGHQIALGSMHQGSDPVYAVKAACKYNAFTEYPIEVFRFKKKGGYKYSKIEKPA